MGRLEDDGCPPFASLTAETWVSADQLWHEQEAQVAAIRFRQDGPTLGIGCCGLLTKRWAVSA